MAASRSGPDSIRIRGGTPVPAEGWCRRHDGRTAVHRSRARASSWSGKVHAPCPSAGSARSAAPPRPPLRQPRPTAQPGRDQRQPAAHARRRHDRRGAETAAAAARRARPPAAGRAASTNPHCRHQRNTSKLRKQRPPGPRARSTAEARQAASTDGPSDLPPLHTGGMTRDQAMAETAYVSCYCCPPRPRTVPQRILGADDRYEATGSRDFHRQPERASLLPAMSFLSKHAVS